MKKVLYVLVGFVVCAIVPAVTAAQIYYPIGYPSYPTTPSYVGSGSACVAITNDLAYGSRGSEVLALQTYIVQSGLPGTGSWMVTGYYGRATEAAVRNFQSAQGLPVTGTVDSYTRGVIQRVSCGYTSSSNTVYPYSYSYNTYNPSYAGAYWYSSPSYSSPTYVSPYTYSYQYPYTNVASVYTGYVGCTGGYSNPSGCSSPVVSYLSPSSGVVGTSVTVYGNGFSSQGNTVRFGTGIITNLSSNDGRSVSFTVPSQLVGYGNQPVYLGSYNVSVTNAGGYTSNTAPFVVTGLGSGSSGIPAITGISGPTSLYVGNQGTWSVSVRNDTYYNNDTYLTTSVRWGDEGQYAYAASSATQSTLVRGAQTLTFTHNYQTPGTYTVTFTVTNSAGRTSSASATVVVTNSQPWYW